MYLWQLEVLALRILLQSGPWRPPGMGTTDAVSLEYYWEDPLCGFSDAELGGR